MKRIPRQKHLTNLAIQYNNSKDQTVYEHSVELIINEYINNDYRILGQPLSIDQISDLYNIPKQLLYTTFNDKLKEMSMLFGDSDLIQTHRSLLAKVFLDLVKDRSLIAQQLTLLTESQGDGYKPYISGSVNEAIKMMMGSTKNHIDFIDKVMPKNTEVMNLIINGSKPDSLTSHEAISLIRQEALSAGGTKALPEHKDQNISNLPQIFKEHQIDKMPSVTANKADEASNINVTAKKLIEDPFSQVPSLSDSDNDDYSLSDYEEV